MISTQYVNQNKLIIENRETYIKTVRSGARDADGNLPPEQWADQPVAPTLNSFDNGGDSRATVLVIDKPDPLTATAIPIQGTIIGRSDTAGPQGQGIGEDGDPSYMLDSISRHGVAQTIGFSHTQGLDPQPTDDGTPTLRAGGGGMAVAQNMTVRRLTPVECERLQGWPDDHTLYRADGKTNPDSTRYKMTGNGVAAPVAKWIAEQLTDIIYDTF
jgi:site-specific DNA-cytosine methylase